MEGEYHGQIWTISFLWKKRKSAADTHCCLAAMCVWRNCPKSQNSVTTGGNFQQCAWKRQGGNQSRPSANSLHVTSCAAGLLHHHGEKAHNNWWTIIGHATIHTIIHKDLNLKKVSAHCFQGISHPNKRTEGCITASGCWLHSSQGLRGVHCQTGYWSRVLGSLSNSEGQRVIHAVETWWQSLSKEISDSILCWKTDGLSILGHGGHPLNWVASPRANIPQWVLLQCSTCLHCGIQPRRQEKWTCQVLFSMTMQDHTAINKQHKHWHPLDISSYHIHHILHIWPHQTTLYSTK